MADLSTFGQTVATTGTAPPTAIEAVAPGAGAAIPSATASPVIVSAARLPSPVVLIAIGLALLYLMSR